MENLDKAYWEERYQLADTPWDTGAITPPLKKFIDQLNDQEIRILIPGAGRAHEADYLIKNGFQNTFICDWSEKAIAEFQRNHPKFPEDQLLIQDFFQIDQKFDLILEQTFFCALPPSQRTAYSEKTAALLQYEGIVAGLLFAHEFPFTGPPFGGTEAEYRQLFSPNFHIIEMQISPDSIQPRLGNELFFRMKKKQAHD